MPSTTSHAIGPRHAMPALVTSAWLYPPGAMPLLTFDHLYGYDELTAALRELADSRPELMTVESVGRSFEGREIWLATVTNRATGPHAEKPAVWVSANIHSVEHTGAV